MVAAIKKAMASNRGSRRSVAVALAMIGVIGTHEGTLPGYTPAVYETVDNIRYPVAPGYWEDWPVLAVIVLSIIGIGLTTWNDWKANGTPPPPGP